MSARTRRSDDFGETPLQFAATANGVVVGSRAHEVAARAGLVLRVDRRAAAQRLLGCLAPGDSLFTGLRRLPPGHELEVDRARWTVRPSWRPPLVGATCEAVPRAPAELLDALRRAVRRHCQETSSGGDTALALSGGLDSSTLLVVAAEQGPARAWTLVSGFSDEEERGRAAELTRRLDVAQREVAISDEALPAAFPRAVLACEDVLWNGAAAAKLLFFERLAAEGEAGLLSGAGADEVLCGHPEGLRAAPARREAERALAESLLEADIAEDLRGRSSAGATAASLVELQDRALRETLHESTLPPECRTATQAGLKVRLPFLDREVAELALRLPLEQRCRDGVGKWLLREATAGLLPDAIRLAGKTPRLVPVASAGTPGHAAWQALREEWLAESRLRALGIVRPGAVRALNERLDRGELGPDLADAASAVLLRLVSLCILDAEASDPGRGTRDRLPSG